MSQNQKLGIPKGLAPVRLFGDFFGVEKVTRSEVELSYPAPEAKSHLNNIRNFAAIGGEEIYPGKLNAGKNKQKKVEDHLL